MANPLESVNAIIRSKPYVAIGAVVVVAGGALLILRRKPDVETEPIPGTVGPAYDSTGTLYSTYPAPAQPTPSPMRPVSNRRPEPNPYVCPRGTVAFTDEQGRQQCRSTRSGKTLAPRVRRDGKWETVKYG
jgi:hypothetical protein